MKTLLFSSIVMVSTAVSAVADSKKLTKFLTLDKRVNALAVAVEPPEELAKYRNKIAEAAKKDPEWWEEKQKSVKAGMPIPFDEKMGLTKEEYAEYLKLWDQRKTVPIPPGKKIPVKLEKVGEKYRITTGNFPFTQLLYDPKKDVFESQYGELSPIEDIDTPAESILRAWKGHEWKFEKADEFSITRENIAIGRAADGKNGFLVYRLQRKASTGQMLLSRSLVLQFSPVGSGK